MNFAKVFPLLIVALFCSCCHQVSCEGPESEPRRPESALRRLVRAIRTFSQDNYGIYPVNSLLLNDYRHKKFSKNNPWEAQNLPRDSRRIKSRGGPIPGPDSIKFSRIRDFPSYGRLAAGSNRRGSNQRGSIRGQIRGKPYNRRPYPNG